jgi:hypothetical protein
MRLIEILALGGPVLILLAAFGTVKYLDFEDRREAAKQARTPSPKA